MSAWSALKLTECIERIPRATKVQRKEFKDSGRFPIVSQERGLVNGYWDDENDVIRVDRPLVIFGDHTQVVKLVDFDFVIGADGVRVLKPKPFLDPQYFYYFLLGNPVRALGYARHFRLLKDVEVAIPPLPEQKRIVAVLDEAFAGIATAVANTEKNLANARELFESYLNLLFERHKNNYESTELQQVANFQGGSQPPKSVFINEPRDGYVRLLQIRDFKSDDKAVFIPSSRKNRNCIPSDIMIGRYGASVGQIHTGKGGAYNVALIKAVPDTSQLTSRYFYYYLLSGLFQNPLASVASRSAQAGFSKDDIAPFAVPMPPISEQKLATESLDELREQSTRLERICTSKLSSLAELKQSLLQKAFSGELTAGKEVSDTIRQAEEVT